MNRTIIHPPVIPVTVKIANNPDPVKKPVKKKDRIRLLVNTENSFEPKSIVRVNYPVTDKDFIVTGTVIKCEEDKSRYNVVIEFSDPDNICRVRMVEQICRIELYKRQVLKNEGRSITKTQAALEWIDKYAKDFMV